MKNTLSIIVPVFNEEKNIDLLVSRIDSTLKPLNIVYQIIFVDDHSTDTTKPTILNAALSYPVKYLLKTGKKGKAFSILEGAKSCDSEFVVMIDGDLQYAPETIPEMLSKTKEFDVIVANRKTYITSKFRHFASRFNALVFGKFLHGLPFDIQSGLKLFRRDIINHIDAKNLSAWSIDLPILYTARELGYRISSVDISFENRASGSSKIRFWNATLGIVTNSLKYKIRPHTVYHINPTKKFTMIGAGSVYRGKRFITHTTLSHHESAHITFSRKQSFIVLALILILSGLFMVNPHGTLVNFVAALSFLYFLDVFFNLYLILKSLYQSPEISVNDGDLSVLDEKTLPVYSVLCPLYREADVLPQFIESISRMDWPKNKLDVLLLLEADDQASIDAARKMKLPAYMRIVVVPDSQPKTKPKACNYGLSHAKGEYIVVYDAEDKPDPDQLKKAYYVFKHQPDNVACLQAKLNYYNPSHNLLTRMFTAEYSLWFDVVLTGLQGINTIIPLGGTSNHFRSRDLLALQGWDPFNVTEDCDLGARLFKKGYKTAVIDSTTLEEANSDVKNWLRQRSRWIKGYIQTYFVHMRHPVGFFKTNGLHSLIFQLVVGGKIAFILINPVLWLITVSYFSAYAIVGPAIDALYPPIVFYMAVTSLIFGNFLCMYYYMIGCIKRGHYSLVKFIFLVPFYWLLVSLAAVRSVIQLFIKPHYWEKTIHGLHLKTAPPENRKSIFANVAQVKRGRFVQKIADLAGSKFVGPGILVFSAFGANILNYLYNAYLGRVAGLSDFGLISLIGSFLYIANVPLGALGKTVTHKSAFLYGVHGKPVREFWTYIRRKSLIYALGISFIWLLITPYMMRFFHTPDAVPFIIFTPIWLVGTLVNIDGGFLGGNLMFKTIALLSLSEAVSKLIFSIILVNAGFVHLVYISVPLSMMLNFGIGWYFANKIKPINNLNENTEKYRSFPRRFFGTSILTSLTGITYLSLDLILAKHYLSPVDAGSYSFLTLAGKMVFFIGGLVSQFTIPLVSKDLGTGNTSQKTFKTILLLVTFADLMAFFIFGVFGYITVPILWGKGAVGIIPYLPLYSIAMVCFSLSSLIITFRQLKGYYFFPVIGFLIGLFQIFGMIIFHESILDIVSVVTATGIVSLAVILAADRFYTELNIIYRNLIDFAGIFGDIPLPISTPEGKLRILVFNWRDLKHHWAGGAEVYIHELSKRWVKMGHTVTIFCGNDNHNPRHETINGIRIFRRGGFYMVYVWAWMYYQFRFKGKFDVIIDSENGIPFFTPLYAREKVFLLIHHVHQEVFRKSLIPPFSWLAAYLEKSVMPRVYRKTECITVSPSSKADILTYKLTQREPHIIYNGVDLKYYNPSFKSKTPLVLYLGRLTALKSVKVLIKAAASIINQVPDVKFIIAGDGPEKNTLIRMVSSLRLNDYFEFTGRITEERKLDLYQKAWIFVNPSLIEGWGITTIEANACGTPVVASNVAGLRDSVHNPHSGFLVPYGNSEEFSKNIIEILTNKKTRNRMSNDAIKWAKNFDWNKSANESICILQRTI
jgi:cellulose synthase/poly-beta-1,6-N-acetylglucosamine synthase-like glycosyltransferase/glycosyltransferase involved in cell wall biosynthesis